MKLQIKFNIEWEDIDTLLSDLTLQEVMHQSFKSYDNYVRGRLIPKVDVITKLRQAANEDILARLVDDNNYPLFTGYLRKTFTIIKKQKLDPVVFELVSPSNRLRKSIPVDISWFDKKVSDPLNTANSIVHLLLNASGIQNNDINMPLIDYTIPIFVNTAGTSKYSDVLDNLLFEYGYVLDFNNEGQFIARDLFPSVINTTYTFNGNNCLDEIHQNKKEEEFDIIRVSWQSIISKPNQIVFSDTTNGDAYNKCSIIVDPDSYMGDGYNEEWSAKYAMENIDLIGARNLTLDIEKEGDIEVQTFTPGPVEAKLKIKNTSSIFQRYIRKLDIKGTAYISEATNVSIVNNNDTDKIKAVSTKYIANRNAGDSLAQKLASYYKYSDFTVKLSSKTDYNISAFVNVSDTNMGTSLCRIFNKKYNFISGVIDYELEAMSEFSAVDTEYKVYRNPSSSIQGEIERRPTISQLQNIKYETRYGRFDIVPTQPSGEDPLGWTVIVPTGEEPLWVVGVNRGFDGLIQGEWTLPVRFTSPNSISSLLTNESINVGEDLSIATTTLMIFEGAVDTTSTWVLGVNPYKMTGLLVNSTWTTSTMEANDAYVDIIASRTGSPTITKRFTLHKSTSALYSLSLSQPVMKIFPDGHCDPATITMTSFKSEGLIVSPYAGVYKILLNGNVAYKSKIKQSDFTWKVHTGAYPAIDLVPSEDLLPGFDLLEITEDVTIIHCQLWDETEAYKLDDQTFIFLKDVGFVLPDIIDGILAQIPSVGKYLGAFNQVMPSLYNVGDWFLIYGNEDTPFDRGVFLVDSELQLQKLDGDSGEQAQYMVAALSDIMSVVSNGFGTTNDYGAITIISNLASNSIFTSALKVGSGNFDTTLIEGGKIKTQLLDVDTILGNEAIFRGTLQATQGLFSGSIESGPLYLNIGPPSSASFTLTNKKTSDFIDETITAGINLGTYMCSGVYNGSGVTRITTYKSSPVIISAESFESYTVTFVGQRKKDGYYYNTYRYNFTSWARNRTETEYTLTLLQGSTTNLTGKKSPSEGWYATGATRTSAVEMWANLGPPPAKAAPTGVTSAYDNTPTLATGNVSFTANSYTMKLVNLPAYSAALPQWTVYLQSDGSGNYNLKVRG